MKIKLLLFLIFFIALSLSQDTAKSQTEGAAAAASASTVRGTIQDGTVDAIPEIDDAVATAEIAKLAPISIFIYQKCYGQVAFYNFNAPGTIAYDFAGGSFNDDGTISATGASLGTVLGIFGGYLDVPNSPDLNFGMFDFSIVAWAATTSGGMQALVDKRLYSGGQGYLFMIYNGGLLLQLADGIGSGWSNYFVTGLNVNDGQYHCIGVTVDRNDPNGITFYKDGAPVGTDNPMGRQGILDNFSHMRVGCHSFSAGSSAFLGKVDELRLFNRALAPIEMKYLCHFRRCIKGCGAWYRFSDPAGSLTAQDSWGMINNVATVQAGLGTVYIGLNIAYFKGGYLETPDSYEIDFGPNQDLTIMAWVKTQYTPGLNNALQVIVDKRTFTYPGWPNYRGYLFMIYKDRLLFQLADSALGWYNYITPVSLNLLDFQWHHVAVSVDRDDPFGLVFYKDGVIVHITNPTNRMQDLSNTGVLRIGAHSFGVNYALFWYYMDEVKIFCGAYTPNQIAQTYQNEKSPDHL